MHRFARRFRAHHDRRQRRGQGLVEFALVLPILLLLTLTALDFGRVYLGYINLQNMARVAANFAANNPTAWADRDTDLLAQYQKQIALDAAATNCQLPGGRAPAPTFTDADGDGVATGVGDRARVDLTCSFGVVTPFISSIVGSSVTVGSSVVFPVKSGMSGTAAGGGCFDPPNAAINVSPANTGATPFTVTLTDASGGCPGTAWLWDFGDGTATSSEQDPPAHTYTIAATYTVTLTVWNPNGYDSTTTEIAVADEVVPPALCEVPRFSVDETELSAAQGIWNAAGFTTTVQPTNGNFKIRSQSLTGGTPVPCDSTITVSSH
jgi:Flp pilus assembly protein TadG